MIPMRTASLTGLIVLEGMARSGRRRAGGGLEAWCMAVKCVPWSSLSRESGTGHSSCTPNCVPPALELEQVLDAEEEVEADQRECGAAPDHQSAFPAEGASDFVLAAPRNQERFVVGTLHQNDRWKAIGIALVGGGRFCEMRLWQRYAGGGPGRWIRDAGRKQRSGYFLLLGRCEDRRINSWNRKSSLIPGRTCGGSGGASGYQAGAWLVGRRAGGKSDGLHRQ